MRVPISVKSEQPYILLWQHMNTRGRSNLILIGSRIQRGPVYSKTAQVLGLKREAYLMRVPISIKPERPLICFVNIQMQ